MSLKIFYKLNTEYSISINPCDKFQYNGRQERLNLFRKFVSEHVVGNIDCDYTFIIEFSEPRSDLKQGSTGPRLHLHGIINFQTKSQLGQFLKIGLYKLLRHSYVDIDTINNKKEWMQYMTKQPLLGDRYRLVSNVIDSLSSVASPARVE